MNDVKPGSWVAMGGAVAILLGSFLDWGSVGPFGWNAYEGDLFGLLGIFLLLLALAVLALTAIPAFAPQVKLPDDILGFTMKQEVLSAGIAVTLISFSFLFLDNTDIGVIVTLLGAVAVTVGAAMDIRAGATPAGGAEPPPPAPPADPPAG